MSTANHDKRQKDKILEGALEGVLTRLAGIPSSIVSNEYQMQPGVKNFAIGSPWDPDTPHGGDDSISVNEDGQDGIHLQQLEPKFNQP